MEENSRKNFLEKLMENVKKALEIEKELDQQIEQTQTRRIG